VWRFTFARGSPYHSYDDNPRSHTSPFDGLDPAFAPGVSHREPGELSTRQVINLIQSIDAPIVAADIVDYNPRQDLSNMTALVAAKLTKEIAGMMLKTAPALD